MIPSACIQPCCCCGCSCCLKIMDTEAKISGTLICEQRKQHIFAAGCYGGRCDSIDATQFSPQMTRVASVVEQLATSTELRMQSSSTKRSVKSLMHSRLCRGDIWRSWDERSAKRYDTHYMGIPHLGRLRCLPSHQHFHLTIRYRVPQTGDRPCRTHVVMAESK